MTDEPTEAELDAIRQEMIRPISREQIVANELWLQLDIADRPTSDWTNDDWLALARHIIKTVEVAGDLSADNVAKAMEAPWPADWPPLPTFDELDKDSNDQA
jgi:hypothetical protein